MPDFVPPLSVQVNTPPLPQANLGELWLWLWRRRSRLRVVGHSMQPTLQPGDEVLLRLGSNQSFAVGDLVVLCHPQQPTLKMIKRITAIAAEDRYWVQGDNPAASTDSRSFGAVPRQALLGKVTHRFC